MKRNASNCHDTQQQRWIIVVSACWYLLQLLFGRLYRHGLLKKWLEGPQWRSCKLFFWELCREEEANKPIGGRIQLNKRVSVSDHIRFTCLVFWSHECNISCLCYSSLICEQRGGNWCTHIVSLLWRGLKPCSTWVMGGSMCTAGCVGLRFSRLRFGARDVNVFYSPQSRRDKGVEWSTHLWPSVFGLWESFPVYIGFRFRESFYKKLFRCYNCTSYIVLLMLLTDKDFR